MRLILSTFCIISFATLSAFAQETQFNLTGLQQKAEQRLLDARPDQQLDPVITHLWRNNGGEGLDRTSGQEDCKRLASELTRKIDYDPATETISWSVTGFGPGQPYTRDQLWHLFDGYFNEKEVANRQQLEANFTVLSGPTPFDPVAPPVGLSMNPLELLHLTGYWGSRLFVYSPDQCYDLALKCYRLGLYRDAQVLLSHAIAQEKQARCYHLKGTIAMLVGDARTAQSSAEGFIAAESNPLNLRGLSQATERVNGPASRQFRLLVEQQGRGQ